jgi:hypothetical protein
MTSPAAPLDLPEPLRAWRHGRCDRIVRARADGSLTLTMLLPGETLEATFPNPVEAAQGLTAGTVVWTTVEPSGGSWFGKQRDKKRA